MSDEGLQRLILWMGQTVGDAAGSAFVAVVLPEKSLDRQSKTMLTSLLERSPLGVVLGADVSVFEDWSVRTADLALGHPLRDERCWIALSHTSAMMLSARKTGTGRWGVVVSQDQGLCRDAVRLLLGIVDELEGGVRHSG